MLEVVLGALISILITIWIENLRKSKLSIAINQPTDVEYPNSPASKVRFLHIEVTNQPLHRFVRWMSREPAMQVHAAISFYRLDGQNVFGREMVARWSGAVEPVLPTIIHEGKMKGVIWDISRLTISANMDIYPGHSQAFDVAAKFDDDEECYGWNNESYFSEPRWRNPAWKLSHGCYLVRVTISTAGEKLTSIYRLINDVRRNSFRIENKLPEDKVLS
jgi:hypothetical protein